MSISSKNNERIASYRESLSLPLVPCGQIILCWWRIKQVKLFYGERERDWERDPILGSYRGSWNICHTCSWGSFSKTVNIILCRAGRTVATKKKVQARKGMKILAKKRNFLLSSGHILKATSFPVRVLDMGLMEPYDGPLMDFAGWMGQWTRHKNNFMCMCWRAFYWGAGP